jgi:predicted DNA-binding transcriptional regulator AlpA
MISCIQREIEIMGQDSNEWLTPKEVAKKAGISLTQVYRYMKETPPPWPFYRVTKTKRLTRRADLNAWLEKVKVPAVMPEQTHNHS